MFDNTKENGNNFLKSKPIFSLINRIMKMFKAPHPLLVLFYKTIIRFTDVEFQIKNKNKRKDKEIRN